MDAYIFQADIYCTDCARELMGFYSARQGQEDSDDYPQGPYSDDGGAADCRQHCGECGTFLENPLSGEGYAYVRHVANKSLPHFTTPAVIEQVREWIAYYDIDVEEDEQCPT